ncbi:MAG TPA: hydrogen peroxide-dependent heme synthase [Actinomycetota bacterium]|nr:hydrogen peroxide-dependent heme synthase [Actinomycetota bacterium]
MDEVTYAYYPVFRRVAGRTVLSGSELHEAENEWETLFKEFDDRVTLRGIYTAQGFRPDADVLMWWVGASPDDLQALFSRFRRTLLGRRLELTWSFLGAARPAEFNPQHTPAFLRGEKPRKYLCVYPFARTPEWYLLPPEERSALLKEHGEMGREFPDVLPNTTSGFGLGDWEWILAFEAERADSLVDVIRRLRDTKARLYTKVEIPFVTGIRKPVAEAFDDLV